ncbi:MAG TPA: Fic family protein [Candidatus Mediterraneibacter intestinipullorum]|nr:Fic family protein [Candidatus Mediterraneibacter intestinipullorum]
MGILRLVFQFLQKGALMSSQIEGTQATLEDILDPMIDTNTNRNVTDVVNYIKATETAIKRLQELPLCNRLIKETHAVLMSGLEKYMNADDRLDTLIQAALIHYQFETIHPFLDGNGRVGRLLITLFLMKKKVLTTPALYISYFLKKNRVEYYDRMTEVRVKGNYEQWVKFFLEALTDSAKDAADTIDELVVLHDKNVDIISRMGRAAKNIMLVFNYLEANPIIEIRKTAEALGFTFNTASSAVNRLVDTGILARTSIASRNRTFAYEAYLAILRKGT